MNVSKTLVADSIVQDFGNTSALPTLLYSNHLHELHAIYGRAPRFNQVVSMHTFKLWIIP